MSIYDFALKGKHNAYNTMAASIAASTLGIRKEKIREAVSNFHSLEHRMEFVATVKGVDFINDSKATNVNSTWYALESMQKPTILILGGVDKGNDYALVADLVKDKVKAIVCMGTDNAKLIEYFKDKVKGAALYYSATIEAQQQGKDPAIKNVEGFVAVDPYTFRIDLVKPFAPFEYYATLGVTLIHPKEAVEKYGKDFFQHPVGTGPFRFISWTPERECILKKNESYWQKDEFGNSLPYLDGITFSFMKDLNNQFVECKNGNLEESFRIPSEFFQDVVDKQKRTKPAYSNYKILHIPSLSTQYYGMLCTGKLFGDKRIRQALNYGIDREQIRKYVMKSQSSGPGIHGLVPPSMVDYHGELIKGYDFDINKARTLLAEAGYPSGKGLEISLQLNNGGGRNLQMAEAVQSQLAKNLGIKVQLKQVEFARHLDEVDAGKVEFFRLGWIADYPDPESFLNLFYGKLVPTQKDRPSPINHTRFQNADFDKLFEAALSENDKIKRIELYRKAEQIAIDNAPLMALQYDEDYRMLQQYVEGYKNNPMDKRMYKYVWFNADIKK